MPGEQAIMERLVRGAPGRPRARSALGQEEALLFSDIRLHIALVLRSRNTHAFRPDLFDDHIRVTAEQLSCLADSNAFVKVRYISEEPLPDKRHIRFLVHCAETVAELGDANAVYDCVEEKLFTREEFSQMLDADPKGDSAHSNVRTIWTGTPSGGGHVETRGLAKIGLSELTSAAVEADERLLAEAVLVEAAAEVWNIGYVPQQIEVHAYEDDFHVITQPVREGRVPVRLMRVQTSP